MDSYYTIAQDTVSEIRERSSRFIAYAKRVSTATEAEDYVKKLRKEHHAARHHCYAYRLGLGGKLNRANDDGEPSGTAGRPILGQLMSAGVTDVVVVVVRYFGGILLGTSGLIAAYGDSTALVIKDAGKEEVVLKEWVRKEVDFANLDRVMKIVKKRELKTKPIEYTAQGCAIEIEVRLSELEDLTTELRDI
ncbi:MAG: YigZ family protein [Rikenellaceae bacterium]